MSTSADGHDLDLLGAIADLRVVTVHQLTLLSGRKEDTVRRQVGVLEKRQLVQAGTMAAGEGRGRPEKILSLTSLGLKFLCDAGLDMSEKAKKLVVMLNPKLVRHQLLINTFRAHLAVMTRTWPEFRRKFVLPGNSDVAGRDDNERASLVPDAIFGLSHTGLGRTLLFFLEADRGTETLASHGGSDIRQKILNYQGRFRSGEYKRYEQVLQAELKGFRVLFVTDQQPRLAALCRVVRGTPPSDFIWLTDEASLVAGGVGAPIWFRGGRLDLPLQSIMGSKMPAVLQAPPSAA